MHAIKNSREISFPPSRISTIDICELGRKKHHVTALLEIDVTDARVRFRAYRDQRGESLSFTAWVTHCVAAAAAEYPQVAAYLKGRRKMAVCEEIDVAVTVEKQTGGYPVPLPLVIRNCGKKSVAVIHQEIRQAQGEHAHEGTVVLNNNKMQRSAALFYGFPAFLRRFIWRSFLLKPRTAMKTMGSVVITSLGMCGHCDGWFIPIGIHPLCIAVGSVVQKPGVVGDKIVIREYLKLTALIDHDVIDGAPAARFIARLDELMQACDGL